MTPERWQQVTAIFHAALARNASARVPYLDEACAGDQSLRAEVDEMLGAHFTEGMRLVSGATIGTYRVEGLIGAGGMGEVYRATDTKFNRPVAIKFLLGDLADSSARHRFQREVQTTSSLNHPHILTVHDVGEFEGRQYLVSEFVDGGTLREWAQRERRGWRQIVELMTGVADGLAAAHHAGILHRDIKPENILITKSGYAKLADFGLAKLQERAIAIDDVTRTATENRTRPGGIIGTVAYMSPEQANGQPLDARSDIFSFGVVLYELLAGRRPFSGVSDLDVLHAVVHNVVEPLPSEVPRALRGVVEKALEKDPADRYQSMRDLVVDLRRQTRQSADAIAPASTRWNAPWKWAAVTGTLVILLAALALWLPLFSGPRVTPAPATGAPRIRTIAVLPLRNLSSDPDQEYFAAGMTEVLTTSLAQISALNVIAQASTMRYQGTQKTIREIAQELHVDGVVEGAAQRSGDRILITVQLIEASTDRHLWAKSYERDLRETLALQSEVAQAIAQEIQVQLTPQERARLTKSRAIDPVAQEADLRGHYWGQRGDVQKSLEFFQQAVAIDPNYAEAYAYIGGSYGSLTYLGLISAQESYPKWRAAVTRALELDETLAEAHEQFGVLLLYHDWNWQESEREFRRAIQLNPNLASVHLWYSDLLAYTGRTTQAVAEARRGQQLNPFNVNAGQVLGYQLIFAQRNDEASELGRKMLELEGGAGVGHWVSGFAYEQQGKLAEAISEFQQAVKLGVPIPTTAADLAHAYAISGKTKEALEIEAELTAKSKQQFVHSWAFAIIETGLGNKDRAFEWLNKGYDERPSDMASIKVDPRMDALRSDPRYQDLLRRMGLPQ